MEESHQIDPVLKAAYERCLLITRSHYENFPVASLAVPKKQRLPLAAIYAFSRTADDFADEGSFSPEERLRRLDEWERNLDSALNGKPTNEVFLALADTAERFSIPPRLFRDLLSAFRQDVTTTSYRSFNDLLAYCRCSANPVGRIVLCLFGPHPEQHTIWSDEICTGLQLANFWQDVEIDLKKGRFYLPLEDLDRFGYTQVDLFNRIEDRRFRDLIAFQVDRTASYFERGRPLLSRAPKGFRLQLSLTCAGGARILDKIRRAEYGVLTRRPKLGPSDMIPLIVRSIALRIS
jgi:phytoene synthase